MSKIGRNDPCPCGSAKKYKNCCLRQEEYYAPARYDERLTVGKALDWLAEHYGKETIKAAAVDFFDCNERTLERKMSAVPEHFREMMMINLNAWLLADATLEIDEQRVRTVDLLLSPNGPKLTPQGRDHLARLASSPLSLYEVQEVHTGTGVSIVDLVDKTASPFFVYEMTATKALLQWDIIGTRCIQQDGMFTFAGEAYPLPRNEASRCLAAIQRKVSEAQSSTDIRSICVKTIINTWVDFITSPPQMPILIDNQTKELLMYTKDYYAVSDWQELERILLAQENIVTDEDGLIWTYIEPIDEDSYRSLARLERMQNKDRLLVECNTTGKADAARSWLEGFAGKFVRHTSRRSLTPSQMLQATKKKPTANSPQEETIPQEIQQKIIADYLTRHYEEWPSVPLPALNGKTPLQAAKLETLRPKLVDLLKQIEQVEARRTRQEEGQALDVSFLWKRLGLENLR